MKLYSYFRSTAAYRVRIALALKNMAYDIVPVNLLLGTQREPEFLSTNPQGLVPALSLDSGEVLAQSMAILEWLEETHPEPNLYSENAITRASQRAFCQHIACDIHPLNNLRVLQYLSGELKISDQQRGEWYAHWVQRGFAALEQNVAAWDATYSLGDRPGMVELMLVPQMYNARRFDVNVDAFPALHALDARCMTLDSFASTHPSQQPDAPDS